MESFFTKRSTLTLFFLVIGTLGILAALNLVKQSQELRQKAQAATTLTLVPAQTDVNQGDEFSLNIIISTGQNQINRADVMLNYDSSYVEGVSFTNGAFLPNVASAGLVENGVANIVLEAHSLQPKRGQNQILATVRFRARNPVDSTYITFSGQTVISAVGESDNVLTSTQSSGVRIIRTVQPDATLTFSPNMLSVQPNQEFTVTLSIDSGANRLTTANVTVNYDNSLLEGLAITQGSYFPTVLRAGSIGQGKATLELGSNVGTPKAGSGIFATLRFRARAQATTTVIVDNTSIIRGIGTDENMLRERTPVTVTISQSASVSPTPGTGGTDACVGRLPLAPTNVRATVLDKNHVALSWAPQANIAHYGIVYGTTWAHYTYGANDVGNVVAFTVSGLTPGVTYYFAVYSVNGCGTSGYSNQVAARTQSTFSGSVSPSPSPSPFVQSPVVVSPSPVFTPIDPGLPPDQVIPFLQGEPPVPPVPDRGTQVTPQNQQTERVVNPLLTPLGGVLLIISAIFLGIFFIVMRRNTE